MTRRGAGRGGGGSPADGDAPGGDAARRRAAGRVRPPVAPAVRRAQRRRPVPPRHGPRGGRGASPVRRIRTGRGGTAPPPGGSSATRWRGRRPRRCGGTPPTCCTSSRTRSCARPSSRATEHLYSPEAARPADGAAIAEIVARWEPAASVAVLEAWWRREPTAFRVMRDRLGQRRRVPHPGRARSPEPRAARHRPRRATLLGPPPSQPGPTRAARAVQPVLDGARLRRGAVAGAGRLLARRQGPVHGAAARPPAHLLGGQGHRDAGADGRAPRLRRAPGRAVRARRPALLRGRARLRPVIDRRLAVGADRRGAPGRRGLPSSTSPSTSSSSTGGGST